MTQAEIMEVVIQKAVDNGWRPDVLTTGSAKDRARYVVKRPSQLYGVLFSHDFARALWGDAPVTIDNGCAHDPQLNEDTDELSEYWRSHFLNSWVYDIPDWAFHLSKMVLADDPIEYLGENLVDDGVAS